MKKIILPALLIGAAISFTSCKKDYTCDCEITTTITDYYGDVTSTKSNVSTEQELKKKDAEEWCDGIDQTSSYWSTGGYSSDTQYSCTLN